MERSTCARLRRLHAAVASPLVAAFASLVADGCAVSAVPDPCADLAAGEKRAACPETWLPPGLRLDGPCDVLGGPCPLAFEDDAEVLPRLAEVYRAATTLFAYPVVESYRSSFVQLDTTNRFPEESPVYLGPAWPPFEPEPPALDGAEHLEWNLDYVSPEKLDDLLGQTFELDASIDVHAGGCGLSHVRVRPLFPGALGFEVHGDPWYGCRTCAENCLALPPESLEVDLVVECSGGAAVRLVQDVPLTTAQATAFAPAANLTEAWPEVAEALENIDRIVAGVFLGTGFDAIDDLGPLTGGAGLYFRTPQPKPGGAGVFPLQFPTNQAPTPVQGTCCGGELGGFDADGDDRCDVDPDVWETPTWNAMGFSIGESHRFVYAFDASGTGDEASFIVTANGDLDCDAVQSTFQRFAYGNPDAGEGEPAILVSPFFYVEKPGE